MKKSIIYKSKYRLIEGKNQRFKNIDENNKKIKGCFSIDKKTGLNVITKANIDNLNSRFISLKDTINENMIYSLDNEPIRIIKIFYDTTV